MRVIVAKVGGSLFDLPDLRQRLEAYFDTVPDARILLVPGGGAGADIVRQWDLNHQLGEQASHWLALRVLSVNAHFLSRLLTIPVVSSVERLAHPRAVVDAFDFCRDDDRRPGSLPHCWDVTSDSIAARVATVAGAELVLFKSTDIPDGLSWTEAAAQGFVDKSFPNHITSIDVSWINLRKPARFEPR